MKKIKALFLEIKLFVLKIWDKADELVDLIAPIAINVVEQIKQVNESTAGDVIELITSKVIKGTADDIIIHQLREKLKTELPKVLEIMQTALNIAKVDDANLQVKQIIAAINLSPDAVKNVYYHTFAVLILEKISDGKLTWSESVMIAEYYYNKIYKGE